MVAFSSLVITLDDTPKLLFFYIWRLLTAEFVVIHIQYSVLHLWSLLMSVRYFWSPTFSNMSSLLNIACYNGIFLTDGARAALNLGGTMLGYYPVRVLPSKTAILPVNPTFLPRVSITLKKFVFSFSMLHANEVALWKISYHFLCSQKMNGKCVAGLYIVQILIRRFTLFLWFLVTDISCWIGH